jgi:hypothetical protein
MAFDISNNLTGIFLLFLVPGLFTLGALIRIKKSIHELRRVHGLLVLLNIFWITFNILILLMAAVIFIAVINSLLSRI